MDQRRAVPHMQTMQSCGTEVRIDVLTVELENVRGQHKLFLDPCFPPLPLVHGNVHTTAHPMNKPSADTNFQISGGQPGAEQLLCGGDYSALRPELRKTCFRG